MAQRAHRLTVQRFGRVMGMFAPLYLSNVCTNQCVYCGFNAANVVTRVTLTPEEAEREGDVDTPAGVPERPPPLGRGPPGYHRGVFQTGPGEAPPPLHLDRHRDVPHDGRAIPGAHRPGGGQPDRLPGDVRRVALWGIPPRGEEERLSLAAGDPGAGRGGGVPAPGDRPPAGVERLAGGGVFRRPPCELPPEELLEVAGRDLLPASPVFGRRICTACAGRRPRPGPTDLRPPACSARRGLHPFHAGIARPSRSPRTAGDYHHERRLPYRTREAMPGRAGGWRSLRWRMEGLPRAVAEVLRRRGYEPVWKEWDAALAS